MAIHERNRAASTLHTIVALLLLLGGGALVGVGIWLLASEQGGRSDLDYDGSSFWKFVLNFGVIAIIGGGFLIVSGIAAIIALSRRCLGKVFRLIYVLMALAIVAVLVFVATVSFLIVDKRDSNSVEDFVRDAWRASVQSNDENILSNVCEIQERWNCVGFNDGDCTGCVTGTESTCTTEEQTLCPRCGSIQRDPSRGCYTQIKSSLRKVYLPLGIVSSILAAVVLLDTFIVCLI